MSTSASEVAEGQSLRHLQQQHWQWQVDELMRMAAARLPSPNCSRWLAEIEHQQARRGLPAISYGFWSLSWMDLLLYWQIRTACFFVYLSWFCYQELREDEREGDRCVSLRGGCVHESRRQAGRLGRSSLPICWPMAFLERWPCLLPIHSKIFDGEFLQLYRRNGRVLIVEFAC